MTGKKLTNRLYSNCGFFMKQFCRVPAGLSLMGSASAICSVTSAAFSSLNIVKGALNGDYAQSAIFLMSAASNFFGQGSIANQLMLTSYGVNILAGLKEAIEDEFSLKACTAILFDAMNGIIVGSGLTEDRWLAFCAGVANAVGGLSVSAINAYQKKNSK